ncbi:MAG: RNA chaperone Hfq [Aquificaceae bacterium]
MLVEREIGLAEEYILLEAEGEPNLIYKHAISTIVQGG